MRNKIFEKIPIKIPRRSGFDLSHETRGTAKVGILVPVMTREMQGHDSLSVNLGSQIQFAPFATDFYGRVKVYFEAFFVPYRIISGSYKYLYRYSLAKFAGQSAGTSDLADDNINTYFEGLIVHQRDAVEHVLTDDTVVPALTKSETADPSVGLIGQGTLLDYLGVKTSRGVYTGEDGAQTEPAPLYLNNYHRLTAYHRIYEEYYADSRIQRHAFTMSTTSAINPSAYLRTVPHRGTPYNSGNKFWINNGLSEASLALLGDGFNICGLRSRLYAKDYFTTATPDPQFGGEMGFTVDENGRATIAQVRAANALQQYCELHNKVGNHYDDLAFALTGIRPSDAAVDIPIYLGRQVYDVYNKSVYDQSSTWGDYGNALGEGPNPFLVTGSKYANGQALGSGHLCDFTATEGGIFMVIMSVAPEASYGTGSDRQWDYDTIFDLPTPHLQGLGDQPIYKGELIDSEYQTFGDTIALVPVNRDNVFGYTQRYAEAKFMLDSTHSLLRDYQSLSAFALKRSFFSSLGTELGREFLEVPTDALDEVSAVTTDVVGNPANPQSTFGYWYDIYFDVKLVSNLSAYSIPTLENMDGNTVMADNGGRRL